MKTDVPAVVIGGGVIGCSILYHLTLLGWSEVMLFERDELTSGSTWHAAANIHGLHDSTNISRLQHYTMDLYRRLSEETGQDCGVFQPGSLYLAQTEAREQQLRLQAAKARYYGMNFHEVTRDEAERLHPLVDFDGVRCIMFEPDGGNVDPSGVTAAYAAGARARGAEIHRFTPVTATRAEADGTWTVETPRGTVRTRWVINAAGLWAREVARMAGIDLPLQPTEHQYLVTGPVPEIAALDRRLPSVADRDGEYYLRQEGRGLLVGAYERDMRFWAEDATPPDFGHELFEPDLDRIEPNLLRAMARVPAVGTAGIRRVINGPMIWSPDGNALVGPVPGKPTYFCCCGIIPGFSQSGGLGRLAAEWIIEGEPAMDIFAWDLARFGAWAGRDFTRARVADQYAHRFRIHFPYEERVAGRPVRTRPAHARQQAAGARFALSYGWEHPAWFAGEGAPAEESYGFTRQPWWDAVAREARGLRERAGIIDISNFARYRVTGPGARAWLDALLANLVPAVPGHSCLAPLIGRRGGIAGDFTVTCLSADDYLMIGSGTAERYHARFFEAVPLPAGTRWESVTDRMAGFGVAGPLSRGILQDLTNADLSNQAFPFFRSQRLTVAGVDCIALRLSFTGDLGWELHCAEADQARLYEALLSAGAARGAGPVGSRALMALRLEKGYGSWGRDYSPEYWPQECGLDGLVRLEKPFLNRDACARAMAAAPREVLRLIAIETDRADAAGGEPIFTAAGRPAGKVSSGGYGAWVRQSLALAHMAPDLDETAELEVMLLGLPHRARMLARAPFDPDGRRLRS